MKHDMIIAACHRIYLVALAQLLLHDHVPVGTSLADLFFSDRSASLEPLEHEDPKIS